MGTPHEGIPPETSYLVSLLCDRLFSQDTMSRVTRRRRGWSEWDGAAPADPYAHSALSCRVSGSAGASPSQRMRGGSLLQTIGQRVVLLGHLRREVITELAEELADAGA